MFCVRRVLALLAEVDECAGDLDEALEEIAVATARAEPEHLERVVRLVVFARIEVREPREVARVGLGLSLGPCGDFFIA